MSPVIDFLKSEGRLLMTYWWQFLTTAALACGIGFGVSNWHYSDRVETADRMRDFYKDCREQGRTEAACPVVYKSVQWRTKTVTRDVPTADPKQAQRIAELEQQLKSQPRSHTVHTGITFIAPPGDPLAGQQVMTVPLYMVDTSRRSSPCVNARGAKGLHVTNETCSGHDTNFDLRNSENADLKDIHHDDGNKSH